MAGDRPETPREVFEALVAEYRALEAERISGDDGIGWLDRFDAAMSDVQTLARVFYAIDYDVDGDELVEDLHALLGVESPASDGAAFGSPGWHAARAERQAEEERLRESWQEIRARHRRP